jgi:flagellar hook-basal body complex protein FliE
MSITPPVHPGAVVQSAYSSSKTLSVDRGAEINTGGFEDLVQKAATDAVKSVREGEAAIQGGLDESLGMQEVVEATMAMESTVKVSIALRDKLVDAYQEILRMPI